MEMNPLMAILIFGALFFLPRLLKKKSESIGGDTVMGEALSNLTDLSSELTNAGFKMLPQLTDALMTNDRKYVDKLVRQMLMAFKNPEQAQVELEDVFTRVLEQKFKDPDKRRVLLDRIKRLEASEKATSTG